MTTQEILANATAKALALPLKERDGQPNGNQLRGLERSTRALLVKAGVNEDECYSLVRKAVSGAINDRNRAAGNGYRW